MFRERSRIILLSGSPLSESLDWSEISLETGLLPAFLDNSDANAALKPVDVSPAWRSLDLSARHLPTGLTPVSREDHQPGSAHEDLPESFSTDEETGFMSTGENVQWSSGSGGTESPAAESQVLSQYYEHSFAAHEDIQSSQILEANYADGTSSSTKTGTSSFESEISKSHSIKDLVHARLYSAYISHLNEIPNAVFLNSIVPQTMTTNLVVGIISISQPRKITTRKGSRLIELVELVVGDDTRAGFGINIWMAPALAKRSNTASIMNAGTLRDQVMGLRPRDVVLARQIALSSFRGKVYGQSLRRGMTTMDLLYRNVVDFNDIRGAFKAKEVEANIEGFRQLDKVKKVKNWVQEFVGTASAAEMSKKKQISGDCTEKAILPCLPPDTQ